MRTTHLLAFATMLVAGTATAASACGAQASLDKAGFAVASASQDLSAASKKMTKDDAYTSGMSETKVHKKKMSQKKTMKRSTTGAPAGVNPSGGPGTGTTPNAKSTSTGNAGSGAGAAGGEAAGTATNSGK